MEKYYPPGTAPPRAQLQGRKEIMMEMNTGLADKLEDDMSDSDDELEGHIESPKDTGGRRR